MTQFPLSFEERVVAEKIIAALENAGVDPSSEIKRIAYAAKRLWDKTARIAYTPEVAKKALSGSFFAFADKMRLNIEWVGRYGASPEKWALACLRYPPYFGMKPSTLQRKFEEKLPYAAQRGRDPFTFMQDCLLQPRLIDEKIKTTERHQAGNALWLREYRIPASFWAHVCKLNPSYPTRDPETLRRMFEVSLALAETEHYAPVRDKKIPSFRELRIKRILQSPLKSVSNTLLRLAYVEITKPAPSGRLFHGKKHEIENDVIDALGFDPGALPLDLSCEGAGPCDVSREKKRILSDLETYADLLIHDLRAARAPRKARPLSRPLLPILTGGAPLGDGKGEKDRAVRARLLRTMALGNLFGDRCVVTG